MKKISIVSIASFAFLTLCSLTEYILRPFMQDQLYTLLIGVGILAISGIITLLSRDNIGLNTVCFVLSSLAMGILIRAWYINRGFDNTLPVMLLISFITVVYLWLFYALSRLPFIRASRRAYLVYAVIFAAVSGIAYLLVMLNTKTTFVSTFGYYMLIELAFILAMSLEVESGRQLWRNLTLSTYSVFAVALGVLVAVIMALVCGEGADCDCDCGEGSCCECLDGCDCGTDLNPGSDKRRKKKQ